MSEIVGACLSQFHGEENHFEFLIAYLDGREIGHSVSRSVARKIAAEMIRSAGGEYAAKDAEIERLRRALEEIRDIEPEQFNAYPADWQDQIKACEKCQSYKDHPLFRGICDTHRQPMYRRDDHDAHQVRALGYRAKSMARSALSPALKGDAA